KADDLAAGHVGDMGLALERHQVVLAHAVEADVAQHDHFVVVFIEADLQVALGVVVQAAEQLGVHAGHAVGRALQAFAFGVLADRQQDLAHRPLDPRDVHSWRFTHTSHTEVRNLTHSQSNPSQAPVVAPWQRYVRSAFYGRHGSGRYRLATGAAVSGRLGFQAAAQVVDQQPHAESRGR